MSVESERSLDVLAGQLVAGGFSGTAPPAELVARLSRGHLGGAILYKRNVESAEQVWELNRALLAAAVGRSPPPILAIDHEGGRVQRLGPPVTQFPPMRAVGTAGSPTLSREIGSVMGAELRALGFNVNFAPVCDVDSVTDSPVIGDRSFSSDPGTVARHAVELIEGLQENGVLACAKHFPGHGAARADSHKELPEIGATRDEMRARDLPPFYAAVGAGVAMVMTAHVVYPALDPDAPATLSPAILEGMLRADLGFDSVVVSDDLEMDAILKHHSIGEAAVGAVRAGCDLLLVCARADRQEEAREALVREAERHAPFRRRLERAVARVDKVRSLAPPRPVGNAASLGSVLGAAGHLEVAARIEKTVRSAGGKENGKSKSTATRRG